MTETEIKPGQGDFSPSGERTKHHRLTTRIKELLDYQPDESDVISSYTSGTILERETHSKAGEHVFIAYNPHQLKGDIPECYVQAFPPGHTKANPTGESYVWNEQQDPEQVYPDNIDRISELVGVFEE